MFASTKLGVREGMGGWVLGWGTAEQHDGFLLKIIEGGGVEERKQRRNICVPTRSTGGGGGIGMDQN